MVDSVVSWFEPRMPALVTGVIILLLIAVGYQIAKRAITYRMKRRQRQPAQIKMAQLIVKYFFGFLALLYLVVTLSGSLAALGMSTAFVTMVMGWSLQRPVTGMAAWLMVMLKRPFSIGDRIIIAGIRGDVADIGLTHILLSEVGGTIGGEEQSNRGILIPNAILFDQTVTNYTMDSKYILDEVVVRITYTSNWDLAEQILIDAAQEVTKDIIADTGTKPFIRADLFDAGVNMRLRYQTVAADRQRISTDIVRIVFRRFRESGEVEFCYPHSEVVYRYKNDKEAIEAPMRDHEGVS